MFQGDEGQTKFDTRAMLGWFEPVRQALHDIGSPIAALEATACQGAGRLPDETLELIQAATRRIRSIAESLKPVARLANGETFSGKAGFSFGRPTAICPVVHEVVEEMKAIGAHRHPSIRISAATVTDAEHLRAIAEPHQLARVIANLIQNGIDAINGAGDLRVTLCRSSDWLVISVRDTGKGIAPEILSQVTQRGFTRGKPCGSGLGLSHADEQVRSWGGRMQIQSALGKGTRVEIWLRACQ